jgi:RNA polymerase sigma-70 factor (ECF subfamily)
MADLVAPAAEPPNAWTGWRVFRVMSQPMTIVTTVAGNAAMAGLAGRRRQAGGHPPAPPASPDPFAEDRPMAPSHAAAATERLAELFDLHHTRLFRLACRLTADREEACDLVQEAFLRAARQPGDLPAGAETGEAWLVRTLVNLCRDRRRRLAVRSRARPFLAAAAALAVSDEPAASPEAAAVAQATVRAALARLSPRRRAVVVLHELEELPVSRIARLLGIAAVTVRWHLLAARRDLAALLLARPALDAGDAGQPRGDNR